MGKLESITPKAFHVSAAKYINPGGLTKGENSDEGLGNKAA